ncbi:restriction endonuclease subunit S [Pectobacterium odoriferum]|uniref:restriction endonuclease subunit S n=1 Tax=Pectobacterium odoriferum TaxID=78398 RepID=UPI000CD2BCFA|nr:restriction endonuclease subunit S [Pectobacterium odoriferum]POE01324.1 restriction endonuclease subunit S [Pectobacterium odoriferum]
MAKLTDCKTPIVRFKGFDGDWVERYLGDLCSSLDYGLNAAATKFDGKNKYLRITDIDDENRNFLKASLTSPKTDLDSSQGYLLKQGDIVFARTGASVGKSYIYKEEDGRVYFAGFLIRARANAGENADFIFQNTLTKKYVKFIKLTSQRSGQPGINAREYSSFSFFCPTNQSEKSKIGQYFKELDRLIELHQHKHKKLVTLKQAMLQKMFPQGGASVPEIRFKGFSEDWEEKNLGNICEIVGGGTPSTSIPEYWGGNIDWYSPTEIGSNVYARESVKKITQLGLDKCSAKILPAWKTVLFTSRAGIGDMAILKKPGCTNQGFQSLVLNDDIDTYFIYSMGYMLKNYALKHASGSTFLEISSKQLKKMEIRLPKHSEQQKIGAYFRKLDELISQHSAQLEKLKQIKSACLAKMFV